MTETTRPDEVANRMQQMYQQYAPMFQQMSTLFAPLQQMFEQFLAQYGIQVRTNKVLYIRDKNAIMFGIMLIAPNDYVAEQIALALTGKGTLTVRDGSREAEVKVEDEQGEQEEKD
jgi:Mg2+ and Co2+ transporter CorA